MMEQVLKIYVEITNSSLLFKSNTKKAIDIAYKKLVEI